MQLGIFAKTFTRDSLEENLDAVRDTGFVATQYNLVCAGLPTLPNDVPESLPQRIAAAHQGRGLSMAAISGTFNTIDPDQEFLAENLSRFRTLARICPELGTRCITICTGTNDPHDMWRWHPENNSTDSWDALLKSIGELLVVAEEFDLCVAFEPEYNNVVASAAKARQLLDEFSSARLKVILDVANLVTTEKLGSMRRIVDEALDLLATEMVICHLKEIPSVDIREQVPIGAGLMDFDYLLASLAKIGFSGPLIMHGLAEQHAAASYSTLAVKLADIDGAQAEKGSTDAVL